MVQDSKMDLQNEQKNILIACEESQRVCIEFRKKGFNAFSCDIQDESGGHPEGHIKQDVLPLLNGNCCFKTQDGDVHTILGKWDLIIAHPPCTYLCNSGNAWFNVEKYGDKARHREREREKAVQFFMKFINADCEHIAVENPIGCMSRIYRKANQIIQPYQFGHPTSKSTCLWLKNLPLLKPTQYVPIEEHICKSGARMSEWHYRTWALKPEERGKERSKTFEGIAKAMAEQWGDYLNDH